MFAGAQTGNVVLLGVDVAGGRWIEALAFLPPLAAFVLGVATAECEWSAPQRLAVGTYAPFLRKGEPLPIPGGGAARARLVPTWGAPRRHRP